jgi:hypothetical protein
MREVNEALEREFVWVIDDKNPKTEVPNPHASRITFSRFTFHPSRTTLPTAVDLRVCSPTFLRVSFVD